MIAKRGLDSICTTDTIVQLGKVLRSELTPAHKIARWMALSGKQVSRTLFVDNDKPYCDSPRIVVMRSRRMQRNRLPAVETVANRPCRRCAKCLQFRQMRWRARASNEILLAKRSWFLTLTFSPVVLAGILCGASGSETEAVERVAYKHVQLYLKRLRKAVPRAKLRYLAIYERGEVTGRSHYHLLLHEVGSRPVSKAILESQWASFVHARLVSDVVPATYITKYLTKSIGIRPRASNDYGLGLLPKEKKSSPTHLQNKDYDVTPSLPALAAGKSFTNFEKGRPNGGWSSDVLAERTRAGFWE